MDNGLIMKNLWAPWRMKYIKDEHSPDNTGCVFCQKLEESEDKKNLVLLRGKVSFIIMNLYPYNNGHLMVVPNRHTSDFTDLSQVETLEINEFINKAIKAISKNMSPHGFNLGINLGSVAGAGIADHIHWHIVPRWEADTNFMPVITDVRVIPQALEDTYDLLKKDLSE